jgi:hypothetical protein
MRLAKAIAPDHSDIERLCTLLSEHLESRYAVGTVLALLKHVADDPDNIIDIQRHLFNFTGSVRDEATELLAVAALGHVRKERRNHAAKEV